MNDIPVDVEGPPPYPSRTDDPDELAGILIAVAGETPPDAGTLKESERIRNFLIFALSIDYNVDAKRQLSVEDREHFRFLHNSLQEMNSELDMTTASALEIEKFLCILRPILHEPCFILGISTSLVCRTLGRFFLEVSFTGHCGSCINGILQQEGLNALAKKLHLDRTLVIPAVIPRIDSAIRHALLSSLQKESEKFFESISGISSSTRAPTDTQPSITLCAVAFRLNKAGREYVALRGYDTRNTEPFRPLKSLSVLKARMRRFR